MIAHRFARVIVAVLTVANLGIGVPRSADAQISAKVHRIGILATAESAKLRESLRELGYIEGRTAVFEARETKGRTDRFDDLARELARLKVDVIVATNPPAALGAKRATATIPIVMMNTPDPVQLGLVSSLARPGGNITGTTSLSVEVSIKQLELLKEAVGQTSRIAVLWNPDNPWHPVTVKGLRQESRSLGVQLHPLPVRSPDEFDAAFQAMMKDRLQAVLVLADTMTYFHRKRLADLALSYRLPLMGALREYAEAGSLMSYWADDVELYRKVAGYVDKILKGAKPADLPIDQPTKYEFVINLKTAKQLAVVMPPSLLLRADKLIE